MNLERAFKNTLIAQLLFVILLTIVIIISELYAPYDESAAAEDINLVFLLGLVLLNLFVWIALYRLKPIGMYLYIPTIIIGIFFSLGEYDILYMEYGYLDMLIEWINGLFSGLIIAFIYFTPLKDKFKGINIKAD